MSLVLLLSVVAIAVLAGAVVVVARATAGHELEDAMVRAAEREPRVMVPRSRPATRSVLAA